MGHDHAHGTGAAHRGRLAMVLALSFVVLVVEAVVAWVTGSLALLADAGHMLGDSFGIVMALAAITVAQRGGAPGLAPDVRLPRARRSWPPAPTASSCWALPGGSSTARSAGFGDSPELEGGLILVAGAMGLVVNVDRPDAAARWCAGEHRTSAAPISRCWATRSAPWRCWSRPSVILLTGWYPADAVASLVIAVMIVPAGDLAAARGRRGVAGVHTSRRRSRGAAGAHPRDRRRLGRARPPRVDHHLGHADHERPCRGRGLGDRRWTRRTACSTGSRECLADHFDVEHSTFQIEPTGHVDSEQHLHH